MVVLVFCCISCSFRLSCSGRFCPQYRLLPFGLFHRFPCSRLLWRTRICICPSISSLHIASYFLVFFSFLFLFFICTTAFFHAFFSSRPSMISSVILRFSLSISLLYLLHHHFLLSMDHSSSDLYISSILPLDLSQFTSLVIELLALLWG